MKGATMLRTRSFLIAVTLGLAAPLLTTTPSTASPPYFETISETFTDHFEDFCDIAGFDVDRAGTFESRLKIRTTKSGLQYFLEHITTEETFTSVASGLSVRIH